MCCDLLPAASTPNQISLNCFFALLHQQNNFTNDAPPLFHILYHRWVIVASELYHERWVTPCQQLAQQLFFLKFSWRWSNVCNWRDTPLRNPKISTCTGTLARVMILVIVATPSLGSCTIAIVWCCQPILVLVTYFLHVLNFLIDLPVKNQRE